SELAGKQVEHLMGIFQMPGTGDWWLFYNDDLLGYYPRDMFPTLWNGACGSAYFGVAARRKPYAPKLWPKTEIGSGQDGSAGARLVTAYVRNPQYVDRDTWYPKAVTDEVGSFPPTTPPDCYSKLVDLRNGYVFLSGPGGYATYCIGLS